MIARYTRPAMGALWTDEARMEAWRRVEVAACEAMEGPSEEELDAIRAATFTVEAVNERERTTDHDLAAFVDVLSASAGDAGRWIHFGLTSSDVLDTATGVQLKAAGEIIVAGRPRARRRRSPSAPASTSTPSASAARTASTPSRRRSASSSPASRWRPSRNVERLERAFAQVSVGAISGAVGTYAATSPDFEERVLEGLGLEREPVSTQVVARDRHAELLQAIALAGAGLERLATEIRHLQRTEVREVEEPFRAGQKGSSAMPHKRNPITTERITGLARVLRGNASAAVENVALWHERDISHSGAERVILPDSTILLDYLQHLAIRVVSGMVVHTDRMRSNLDLTYGALFSQRVLLALVSGGMTRDDAYRITQELTQKAWDERTPLRDLLDARPELALDLDEIFDLGHYTRYAEQIVGRLP